MPTINSDLQFDPEVLADLAQAEWHVQSIVGTSTAVQSNDTLQGRPGSTIRFPKWTNLTEMEDIAESAVITPETLTQEASEAKIKEAAKGVEYTDTADLVGLGGQGSIETEAVRQFGVLAARKVDKDLTTAATAVITGGIVGPDGTPVRDSKPFQASITGGKITWPGIVDALEQFGDEFNPEDFTGLFIRAEQRSQIMKDDTFIRASELNASGGSGSMVRRGFIGEVGGLSVYVTNRLALGKALVLKKSALGLLYKRRPIIERDRDILKRTNVVTINLHYAVKRLNDRGVLDLTISA